MHKILCRIINDANFQHVSEDDVYKFLNKHLFTTVLFRKSNKWCCKTKRVAIIKIDLTEYFMFYIASGGL